MMTCTLYLVVSTSLLSDSLSGIAVPRSVCSLVSLMFLLPCLLLTDLRPVSTLSLLCSLAHILIRWFNRSSVTFALTEQCIRAHCRLISSQTHQSYDMKTTGRIYNLLSLSLLRSFSSCCKSFCLLPPASHCCYWLFELSLMPGVLHETVKQSWVLKSSGSDLSELFSGY